jgi:hypothetical protein
MSDKSFAFARVLKHITGIQNLYDKKGAMKKSLPHLATRCEEVAKEVLGFLCIMLFNANTSVQVRVQRVSREKPTKTIPNALVSVFRIQQNFLFHMFYGISASYVGLLSVHERRSVLHGC